MSANIPQWLKWARELQALAQTGLTYSTNEFDIQRYTRLMEIAAEMADAETGAESAMLLESFQAQMGYATPKVDVRAGIIRDGHVLLVRERTDGRWSMPGGWADVGEMPSAVAVREAWEESGFTVRADKLVGVYDANHIEPLAFFHAYKLVFLCTILEGEPRISNETTAVDFFSLDNLPPLSEQRTNKKMLMELFAHQADSSRLTFFE
jgi:ADP-ribose pyrophosphatase YjhB (NUDIX family)